MSCLRGCTANWPLVHGATLPSLYDSWVSVIEVGHENGTVERVDVEGPATKLPSDHDVWRLFGKTWLALTTCSPKEGFPGKYKKDKEEKK